MGEKIEVQKDILSHEQLTKQKLLPPEGTSVVGECYCHNGHSLIDSKATFGGYDGLTVELRSESQTGQLSLSPVIGDMSRTFFNFDRVEGETVEICCPTCSEPLPHYDACNCGAYLVAMFSTPDQNFANCIGICQRIGCLHSKIITNYNLRKFSRNGFY